VANGPNIFLKPNLRHKRKVLSELEGLLVLEVIAEGVRAGRHSVGWRERVPWIVVAAIRRNCGRRKKCGQPGWKAD